MKEATSVRKDSNRCNNVNIAVKLNSIVGFPTTIPITHAVLKIAHLNIRSLRNTAHSVQLRDLAISSNIDVLTISETWLNTTCTNFEIGINGYQLFRLDRLHKIGWQCFRLCSERLKNLRFKRTFTHF